MGMHEDEYTNEYTSLIHEKGTVMIERISVEQLRKLDADEKASLLFYLTGYLEKSDEFQVALADAYESQMNARARRAERA